MKKSCCISFFLIFMLSLMLPVSTQAQLHNDALITTGFTEDGTYYEVYGESPSHSLRSGDSRFVTREIVYNGDVIPPREITWQEYINGQAYTGTIYLLNAVYNPKTNKTTANYQGVIAPD